MNNKLLTMTVIALLICGSSAEIYTWNGYTMRLVLGGKVIHEVVGYTELVPASAFTQTLDVNWF